MSRFPHALPVLFLLIGVFLSARAHGPEDGQSVTEEKEWLEYYYENPTPDRLASQMKDWAQDGTLDNDHAKPTQRWPAKRSLLWYQNTPGREP